MNGFVFENFIADDKGEQVRTSGGILYTFEDINGEERIMVIAEESAWVPEVNEDATARSTPCVYNPNVKLDWNEGDTKMLLDKYTEYLPQVGPLKKFRNKKRMWDQISDDILKSLNCDRSSARCVNRYKTIMKRKVQESKVNNTSGSSTMNELDKIKAIDDSLEPEVLLGVHKCVMNEKANTKIELIQKNIKKKRKVMTY